MSDKKVINSPERLKRLHKMYKDKTREELIEIIAMLEEHVEDKFLEDIETKTTKLS